MSNPLIDAATEFLSRDTFNKNRPMIEAADIFGNELNATYHDHLVRSNFHRSKSKDSSLSSDKKRFHADAADYYKRAYNHYQDASIHTDGPYRSHLMGAGKHAAEYARQIEKKNNLDTTPNY